MACYTYAEVLIFDSMLVESLSERLYTEVEHTFLFVTALSDEQIIHLFVYLRVIEEFTEYMSGKEDSIWYATNIEIYEYIEDYNRLIWAVDGSIVKNPTNRTLWLQVNNKTVSIAPGEQLFLD